MRRQCALLGVSRGRYYYTPQPESAENLAFMRRIDQLYLEHPVYGEPAHGGPVGPRRHAINRKQVQRLMELMGLEAQYPKPRTSQPGPSHAVYPYLLADKVISGPDQTWCADIAYSHETRASCIWWRSWIG